MSHISDEERVEALLESRNQRPGWGKVPEGLRPARPEDGYRLQQLVYARMAASGKARVGYKIGCTAPASQSPYGLSEPIYAGIFAHTRRQTLAAAFAEPLLDPSIECEVAVTMGRDVDPRDAGSGEALLAAIATMHVACEVVDSRYGMPPGQVGVPTLLTDDFLHAGFVLGPPVAPVLGSLQRPVARLDVDGDAGAVLAADALSPLAALGWLVHKLAENGFRLRGGEIVMTGSIFNPVSIATRPDALSMSVEGLGTLALPG